MEDDDDAGEALGYDLDEQRSEDEEEQDDEMQSFIVSDDEGAEEGVLAAQDQILQHLLSSTEQSFLPLHAYRLKLLKMYNCFTRLHQVNDACASHGNIEQF